MILVIKELSADIFEITVSSDIATTHKVAITDETHQSLTGGLVSKESLLEFSFQFLLEREPNTSIMASFEITVISRYFPEYKNEVRKWCRVLSSE